jgi:hypothetical protein
MGGENGSRARLILTRALISLVQCSLVTVEAVSSWSMIDDLSGGQC